MALDPLTLAAAAKGWALRQYEDWLGVPPPPTTGVVTLVVQQALRIYLLTGASVGPPGGTEV